MVNKPYKKTKLPLGTKIIEDRYETIYLYPPGKNGYFGFIGI